GAGRVVGTVEVEHETIGIAGDRHWFEIAANRVGLAAGGRVAKEDRDGGLVHAGLEEAQRGELVLASAELERQPAQAAGPARIASRGEDDLFARCGIALEAGGDLEGGVGCEPARRRTVSQPWGLRVEHEQRGEILVREADGESADA